MKLATFTAQGLTRTGIVIGDTIIDTGVAGTMIDLIRDWDRLKPELEARAAAGGGIPLAEVKLEAPVQRPGKIFAIGLNYADHIAESNMPAPERQVWFTKAQTSVNAPYDPIAIARGTMTNDYEVVEMVRMEMRDEHALQIGDRDVRLRQRSHRTVACIEQEQLAARCHHRAGLCPGRAGLGRSGAADEHADMRAIVDEAAVGLLPQAPTNGHVDQRVTLKPGKRGPGDQHQRQTDQQLAQHRRSALGLHHALDMAEAVDLAAHHIARLQEGARVHRRADAAGRAGEQHVAGLQRHAGRKMLDLLPDVEDEVPGV